MKHREYLEDPQTCSINVGANSFAHNSLSVANQFAPANPLIAVSSQVGWAQSLCPRCNPSSTPQPRGQCERVTAQPSAPLAHPLRVQDKRSCRTIIGGLNQCFPKKGQKHNDDTPFSTIDITRPIPLQFVPLAIPPHAHRTARTVQGSQRTPPG